MSDHQADVIQLLKAWGTGDLAALDELTPESTWNCIAWRAVTCAKSGTETPCRPQLLSTKQAQVVELKFFGGLSVEETAEVLKVSPQTVMRDWKMARAWLMTELGH